MVITRYKVKGPPMKIAVVADLHGEYDTELIDALENEKPDVMQYIVRCGNFGRSLNVLQSKAVENLPKISRPRFIQELIKDIENDVDVVGKVKKVNCVHSGIDCVEKRTEF